MPTEHQPAASGDGRARYPDVKRAIGEDPARFLDHQLVERGPAHTDETMQRLVRARIRGIDRRDVAARWLAVERDLERGPRRTIIDWLTDRMAELDERGDRPDRLPAGPRRPPEAYEQDAETPVRFVDEDGEEYQRSATHVTSRLSGRTTP